MKKECLIVVNTLSGNSGSLDVEKIKEKLSREYLSFKVARVPEESIASYEEYSGIAVCGGDGTLNRMINTSLSPCASLYYVPCGTLNEVYGAQKECTLSLVGSAGDLLFSYVCATGTFTPLGYAVDVSSKKKIKALAYILKVIREYKVWDVKAKINLDGKKLEGDYTLLMLLHSPRCFGFNFNKGYKKGEMCLLTIKSPGKDNLINRIKIFFPFFRAFFMGFNKPYESKNMLFTPFKRISLTLSSPTPFCVDGEEYKINNTVEVNITKLKNPIKILNA